jgi:hypothetical protein
MTRIHLSMVLAGGLTLAGAGLAAAQPAREWPTHSIAAAPAEFAPAIQRGDLLIASLQVALLSELRRAIADNGPAGALASCHLDATGVEFRIARKEGIAAGRTSARLRNPTNAPRPWARAIVARYADAPASGVDGFAVDLGDRVGLLRPIVQQPMCAACHGSEVKLDPRVRELLPDRYPADRAVGFENGAIRGWFWVEIPKPRPPAVR